MPTLRAHSEAIVVETEAAIDPADCRAMLESAPGVRVVDDPANLSYPLPLVAAGRDDVDVGRIRQSLVFGKHGLEFFVSGDQVGPPLSPPVSPLPRLPAAFLWWRAGACARAGGRAGGRGGACVHGVYADTSTRLTCRVPSCLCRPRWRCRSSCCAARR